MREGVILVAVGVGLWMMFLAGITGDASGDTSTPPSLASGPAVVEGTEGSDPAVADDGTPEDGDGDAEATPTEEADADSDANSNDGNANGDDGEVYIVQAGDTMARIAQRHNVTLQQLTAANPQISNPTRIEIGQRINIPR